MKNIAVVRDLINEFFAGGIPTREEKADAETRTVSGSEEVGNR